MPRPWKRPTIPPSPLGELNRELHELHYRAGWPSSREIERVLEAKGAPMSHTKVHDTLTKPVLPTKGAVEMITEVLAEKVRGADVNAEIDRLLGLWQDAALGSPTSPPPPTPPKSPKVEPSPSADGPPSAKKKGEEKPPPHHSERAMVRLGDLYAQQGKTEEAVVWLLRAADAGNTDAMVRLGELYAQQGKTREAATWLHHAVSAGNPIETGVGHSISDHVHSHTSGIADARRVRAELSTNGLQNIEFTLTNHGTREVLGVQLEDVRRENAEPGESWQPNPNVRWPCEGGGFLLAPGEGHLQMLVQLLDSSGEVVNVQRGLGVEYSLRFQDVDGQWWRRTGSNPEDVRPIDPPNAVS